MNMNYIPSKPKGQNGYISDNLAASINTAISCASLSISHEECVQRLSETEQCSNCAHYGWVDTYNACADGSWFKILRDGPLSVSYCGWCKHFVNTNSPEGKAIQYSKYKKWLLKGMGFHNERESR